MLPPAATPTRRIARRARSRELRCGGEARSVVVHLRLRRTRRRAKVSRSKHAALKVESAKQVTQTLAEYYQYAEAAKEATRGASARAFEQRRQKAEAKRIVMAENMKRLKEEAAGLKAEVKRLTVELEGYERWASTLESFAARQVVHEVHLLREVETLRCDLKIAHHLEETNTRLHGEVTKMHSAFEKWQALRDEQLGLHEAHEKAMQARIRCLELENDHLMKDFESTNAALRSENVKFQHTEHLLKALQLELLETTQALTMAHSNHSGATQQWVARRDADLAAIHRLHNEEVSALRRRHAADMTHAKARHDAEIDVLKSNCALDVERAVRAERVALSLSNARCKELEVDAATFQRRCGLATDEVVRLHDEIRDLYDEIRGLNAQLEIHRKKALE